MATASLKDGDVTFWDLNGGGRIMGVLRNAHNPPSSTNGDNSGGISRVEFLPGQAVLVTSGRDNALKSWIFDESPFSPTPRILHSRCGHAAPITRLNFLPVEADGADAVGKWLLSAGKDHSLWGWSLRRDGQSTELSQGNIRKQAKKLGLLGKALELNTKGTLEDLKAPEITCIACSLNRDGGMGTSTGGGPIWANVSNRKDSANTPDDPVTGWESIVTGHKGDKFARTWFWGRKKAGRWAFETHDGTTVTSVAISPCGTFALVGSAGGSIDMFNLQSGIRRQRFPAPLTPAQAKKLKIMQANGMNDGSTTTNGARIFRPGEGRHTRDVTGLMVDGLNTTVISCGLDGKTKFWSFLDGTLLHQVDWSSTLAIASLRHHRASDLIALSCDDLSIRIIDIQTRNLVRELWGCIGQVSDFCFSNDGRWIIAASMDSVIRVWDLPTGHLINAIRISGACTALAFSPTGEFLATAHANTVGINIWTNRALFTHVPTRQITDSEIIFALAPTPSGSNSEGLLAPAFEDLLPDDEEPSESEALAGRTDQLSADLLTLSLLPRSRWQTLLHLDTIRSRNKPIEPPKAPEKAPFFLPSIDVLSLQNSQPSPAVPALSTPSQSKVLTTTGSAPNATSTLLVSCDASGDWNPFLTHLSSLSPSATDILIRSLSHASDLVLFIRALTARLREKRDFELVQTWMAVFLRVHGEEVIRKRGVKDVLREWREVQREEMERLGALVGYCGGVVGWVRSGR
jgi:U3 small nucleolar RNA-associated protein 21